MTIVDVEQVGFEVARVFVTDDKVAVYAVSGFGVSIYVRADDTDAFASLTDPDAQAARAAQFEAGG